VIVRTAMAVWLFTSAMTSVHTLPYWRWRPELPMDPYDEACPRLGVWPGQVYG
jgi:hypothetical protein